MSDSRPSLPGVTNSTWTENPPQGPFHSNDYLNVGYYGDNSDPTSWTINTDSVCNLDTTDPHYCDCSSILLECGSGEGIDLWTARSNKVVGNKAKGAISCSGAAAAATTFSRPTPPQASACGEA